MASARRFASVIALLGAVAWAVWWAAATAPVADDARPCPSEQAPRQAGAPASPAKLVAAPSKTEVRERRRAVLRQSRAPTTGWVVFEGISTDLKLQLDGERQLHSHIELPPGTHEFDVLGLAHRSTRDENTVSGYPVLAQGAFHVDAGETVVVRFEEFVVPGYCVARREGARLLPLGPPPRRKRCCKCEQAFDMNMEWLARHQATAGTWSTSGYQGQCIGTECEGAVTDLPDAQPTGLALLAFLGYGETHVSGTYKAAVKRGLKGLKNRQTDDGRFAPRADSIEHAVAALAMTEAYGMTGSRLFKTPAGLAVQAIADAEPTWQLEALVWQACVVRSAELAEMPLPDGLRERVTYQLRELGDPSGLPPRHNAMLLAARLLLEEPTDPAFGPAAHALNDHADALIERGSLDQLDPTTAFFGSMAQFRIGGAHWKRWNTSLKALVVDRSQQYEGWPTRNDAVTGHPVDRVTATALLTLSTEYYYRYGRVFGNK